jgi:hypothetical protein
VGVSMSEWVIAPACPPKLAAAGLPATACDGGSVLSIRLAPWESASRPHCSSRLLPSWFYSSSLSVGFPMG